MHTCGKPLAMVSMDNCSHNGAKLQGAILEFVDAWKKNLPKDVVAAHVVNLVWNGVRNLRPDPTLRVRA